ncbi:tyrosine-type recombinase/integrase [Blastopirellula marina]|uniref:Tyr recombinase domain-containing protein n=1 Tax=Blastopirellula marina DSM 3645 TaxID=314230 RepID=A3ZUX3_9BACT|nr:site-specific integrase [Blastopirellula marina]EAQ79709.1 hypothetical protein DSM3645_24410 [Blastopirellula marina DSM 3645]
MEDIKVLITQRDDRKFWQAYYVDPITGKQKFKSTGETSKREAERAAAKWEQDLREGRYKAPSKVTWEEFRERFETQHVASLANSTGRRYSTALNVFENTTPVNRLRDVDAKRLSQFQTALRAKGTAEATIAAQLRHVKAALRWAHDMGLIPTVPKIKMPKRVKGASMMKGRAITAEEFDRMVVKIRTGLYVDPDADKKQAEKKRKLKPKPAPTAEELAAVRAIEAAVVASWEHFLRGLWLSGLRLGESLNLFWDGAEGIIADLDRRFPIMVIPAEAEKGNKDRLLPITPDFARFLAETPREQRTGRVFGPLTRDAKMVMLNQNRIGARITAIGKAAGVKVKDDGKETKFASAHDMRRAFGHRWSKKVMPAVLKELMRHEAIQTTMSYYVGQNAESIANQLWAADDGKNAASDGKNEHFSEQSPNSANSTGA